MGHEYFAEVSEDFIEDDFNLTGLQAQVPMYKDALEMILDVEPSETSASEAITEEEEEEEEEEEDDGLLGDELDEPPQDGSRRPGAPAGGRSNTDPASTAASRRHLRSSSDTSVIEASAELLYGLIHARYITSRPGIQQMLEKYELSHFGHCPRTHCSQTKVLPVGRTDTPGQETVKLFCPSCLDLYNPPNSRFHAVDGAFFGTTFGSLFFMTFPDFDISPPNKNTKTGRNNEAADEDSVMSPSETNNHSNMTVSRSSSLTLPNAPNISQSQKNKDEKALKEAAALAALDPQPNTINGMATSNLAPGLGRGKIYEPKIYGFRVSELAKGGPRMKWLRNKPLDIRELDESKIFHQKYGGNVDGDPEPDEGEEAGDENGDIVMASQSQPPKQRKATNKKARRGQAGASRGNGVPVGEEDNGV